METNAAESRSQLRFLNATLHSFLWKFYRFGGSLKLAVVVILGLAATLSFATVYESLHGTKEVQAMVYNTLGFITLLTLLGINISFSAAQRFPWKKRLAGFVLAHAGILMILYGGALTRMYGLDGTLSFTPGESTNLLTIDDPQIEVWDQNKKGFVIKQALQLKASRAPLDFKLQSTDGEHHLKVLKILPKALSTVEFRKAPQASLESQNKNAPAIMVELSSQFMGMNVRQWLKAGDAQWGSVTLGLATLSFVADSVAPQKHFGAKAPSTHMQIHGQTQTPADPPRNELQILATPDLDLKYLLHSRQGEKRGSFAASDLLKGPSPAIETGWRDIKVRIITLVPNAELMREYHEPSSEELSRQNDWNSAIEISMDGGNSRFMEYQDSLQWNQYLLRFGPQLVSLPFALKLQKFEVGKYPGTDRAKTYSSFVELQDPTIKTSVPPIHITMNEPFTHRALTFYQASFQNNNEPGQPAKPENVTSVLSVGLDPGRGIKYFGSILLVLGIVVMFLQKRGLKFLVPRKTIVSLTFCLLSMAGSVFCPAPCLAEQTNTPPQYDLNLTPKDVSAAQREALELISHLPIQNGGRIKPLDSFARDTILFISEGRKLAGVENWDSGLSPILLLRDWLLFSELWSKREFIPVRKTEIILGLGLTSKKYFYYSPMEIMGASKLQSVMANFGERQRLGQKFNNAEKDIQRILEKAQLFQSITSGTAWTIIPAAMAQTAHTETLKSQGTESSPNAWLSLVDPVAMSSGIGPLLARAFETLNPTDVRTLAALQIAPLARGAADAAPAEISESSPSLKILAENLKREVQFNRLRPFQKSWILYGLAFLLLLLSRFFASGKFPFFRLAGLAVFLGALAMHTYGFAVRCLLTGHPPVTNMYESTVWVPWGVAIFALGIFLTYRKNPRAIMILLAASLVSMLALILSDNVPAVLDPTIRPLEPVLRSNYWLTIHVLTITLAYAAFALSLGLGNLTLGYYLFKPQENQTISIYTEFTYRAVQVGVVLLAAGTILGGVWADYSWGRFWGWDPKETWALIALLLYVAVLHGRWSGWLSSFGLILGTVSCFLGVLMAWYGVNFVLGVGLHSYGFSRGGLEYVMAFIAVQTIFVVIVAIKHKAKLGPRSV